MELNNKTYDTLKYLAMIVLPAIGSLYFGLAELWHLPYGAQVVGTITLIDTFLGALLKISSTNYTGDGLMIVDTSNPEKDIYRMTLNSPVEQLTEKDSVTFKVIQGELNN